MMQIRSLRGFTLIEISIVLTIVGVVIGGIWLATATVMNNNKITETQRQMVQIVQNIKTLFQNRLGPNPATGFTTAVGISAGVFPSGMVISNGTTQIVKNPFATDLTQNSVAISGTGNIIFVAFGRSTAIAGGGVGAAGLGLTSNACVGLASQIATQENMTRYGIQNIWLNGIQITFPVAMSQISGSCNRPGGSNAVALEFTVP